MIVAEHPFRKVPDRVRPREFPYSEHPEIPSPGRAFPCGYHDGGYLYGPADECRAADVLLEDYVAPPLYTGRPGQPMRVESTHTETVSMSLNPDGTREAFYHLIQHPQGLARPREVC